MERLPTVSGETCSRKNTIFSIMMIEEIRFDDGYHQHDHHAYDDENNQM